MNLALGVIYAIITSLYAPYGASISFLLLPDIMVEDIGFEPMTPCLQGKCSPAELIPQWLRNLGSNQELHDSKSCALPIWLLRNLSISHQH